MAVRLNSLGCDLYEQRRTAAARELWEQARDVGRRALGDDHPETREACQHLARLAADQRDESR